MLRVSEEKFQKIRNISLGEMEFLTDSRRRISKNIETRRRSGLLRDVHFREIANADTGGLGFLALKSTF